jgi:hypothetical protein
MHVYKGRRKRVRNMLGSVSHVGIKIIRVIIYSCLQADDPAKVKAKKTKLGIFCVCAKLMLPFPNFNFFKCDNILI